MSGLVDKHGKIITGGAILAHPDRQALPPVDAAIYHLANPHLPQFRFEFHATVRKVYLIRKGVLVDGREVARAIADDVRDDNLARYIVGSWCMGYRQAELDRERLKLGAGDVGETEGKA